MSVEFETNVPDTFMTSFWAGERGKCVQITFHNASISRDIDDVAWKSFTREEIINMRDAMNSWIDGTYKEKYS